MGSNRNDSLFTVGAVLAVVIDLAGAIWLASTASSAFGAVVMFVIGAAVLGFVLILLLGMIGGQSSSVQYEPEAVSTNYAPQPTASTHRVPLEKWRGVLMMTKAATVDAWCDRCDRRWVLEGKEANTIADAQGLSNRLIRGGTKLEQGGATFTAGASGRRIAAGNERERQERDLALVLSLAACPSCHQIDKVHLTK